MGGGKHTPLSVLYTIIAVLGACMIAVLIAIIVVRNFNITNHMEEEQIELVFGEDTADDIIRDADLDADPNTLILNKGTLEDNLDDLEEKGYLAVTVQQCLDGIPDCDDKNINILLVCMVNHENKNSRQIYLMDLEHNKMQFDLRIDDFKYNSDFRNIKNDDTADGSYRVLVGKYTKGNKAGNFGISDVQLVTAGEDNLRFVQEYISDSMMDIWIG